MLFNSFEFAGLLILTFLLYYIPALKKVQITILLISSLVFYSFDQPILVLLLILSCLINTITSYYIVYSPVKRKKLVATLGLVANLLILVFFKYSPLFSRSFFNPASSVGEFLLTIPLPIGISFFTFQGISLVVDVYTQKYFSSPDLVPKSFIKHLNRVTFFISFFPQLIAGPIMKAHDFMPQLNNYKLKDIDWWFCFKHLILGYFLKMVVADNLKDYTFWIEYPYFQGLSTFTLLLNLVGYACQIFADFAGYSLIAMGLAGLFGYKLMVNFDFPFIAASFSELWRRWHISLSTFLMEYLYFPLGGNRKGRVRTYVNLMITMLLGGLWHGASWNYMVWGGLHGVALAIERLINDYFKIRVTPLLRRLKIVMVFAWFCLTLVFIKLSNFNHILEYFKAIFNNLLLPNSADIINYVLIYSLPVAIYHAFYIYKDKIFSRNFSRQLEYSIYGFLLFMLLVNSGSTAAFFYFQF